MSVRQIVITAALFILSAPLLPQADTIHVPNDQPTIQDGIDAAFNADTILVAEDVTPAPYNQPPYPGAGDTDSDACTIVGLAPRTSGEYNRLKLTFASNPD